MKILGLENRDNSWKLGPQRADTGKNSTHRNLIYFREAMGWYKNTHNEIDIQGVNYAEAQ